MFRYKHIATLFLILLIGFSLPDSSASQKNNRSNITLPKPDIKHGIPLNSALKLRRSHRRFSAKSLSLTNLSQLLWSAQGKTHLFGFRTAPSAGAIHPIEMYVVVSNVDQLQPGIYHYKPGSHRLALIVEGKHRKQLYNAAGRQSSIANAAATFVITGVIRRTEKKYGQRAKQYVHIETGSVAQNIYLQAASLNLGTVFVGSFEEEKVKHVIQLPQDHIPLGLMPISHRP